MPPEQWAPIRGFDGYEASRTGLIRSVDRYLTDGRFCGGQVLALHEDGDGYLYVTIGGTPRHVARLVLLAWKGEPRSGQEACHKNGIRKDCHIRNLRWGTRSANARDRERHRRQRQRGPLASEFGQL